MKRLIPLLAAFCASASCLADIVTLKDGTKREGEIKLETPDLIELRWQVRPGINRTDQILKKDIAKIQRDTPEDLALRNLGELIPTPDRLTVADYLDQIAKCKAFLNVFPKGKHSASVQEIMDKLEAERELAEAGGLKLKGKWIAPAARARDAYAIDASIELDDMKADYESKEFKHALRHFETIQSDFPASKQHEEARELAQEILVSYRPAVQQFLARVPSALQRRANAVRSLRPGQREQEQKALDIQDASYRKLIEKEKQSGTKWLTLEEHHKDPMRLTLNAIDQTLKALEDEPEEAAQLADELHRQTWDAAKAGNLEDARAKITELRTLKVPQRYLEPLEELSKEPEVPVIVPEETDTTPEEEEKPADEEKKPKKKERATAEEELEDDLPPVRTDSKKGSPTQLILVIVLVAVIVGALIAAFAGKKK